MTSTKKLIEIIEKNTKVPTHNAFRIGILPNDGNVILGFPDAVLSFSEEAIYIVTFEGLMIQTLDTSYTLKINEIKDIEMGKYNLKDRYLKITFRNDHYVAFNYHLKDRKYEPQQKNVEGFLAFLENLAH